MKSINNGFLKIFFFYRVTKKTKFAKSDHKLKSFSRQSQKTEFGCLPNMNADCKLLIESSCDAPFQTVCTEMNKKKFKVKFKLSG